MKPALLVMDIQNRYLSTILERDKKMGLEYVNGLLWLFRNYNHPIINVYHTDPLYGPKPGTEEFKYPTSVNTKPEDSQIIKNYPGAFKKTELDNMLKEKGCDTLFLCGLSAIGCVLATYFSAMEREYNAFMIKDAIMSHDSTYTKFVEQICETVSFKILQVMFENNKRIAARS